MEIKDIIQAALSGIMSKPGKRMKNKAYKKKEDDEKEDDDENEGNMPKEVEITIMSPMSLKDRMKKKTNKKMMA